MSHDGSVEQWRLTSDELAAFASGVGSRRLMFVGFGGPESTADLTTGRSSLERRGVLFAGRPDAASVEPDTNDPLARALLEYERAERHVQLTTSREPDHRARSCGFAMVGAHTIEVETLVETADHDFAVARLAASDLGDRLGALVGNHDLVTSDAAGVPLAVTLGVGLAQLAEVRELAVTDRQEAAVSVLVALAWPETAANALVLAFGGRPAVYELRATSREDRVRLIDTFSWITTSEGDHWEFESELDQMRFTRLAAQHVASKIAAIVGTPT
jgi:hypothetical protein